MILLSVLSVIRHLMYGNNWNWLLNLNLIYKTLDMGRKWLVDFNAGKTHLVLFDESNSTGAIDVKMDGSVLEEKLYFEMLGLAFTSKFDWSFYSHVWSTVVMSGLVPLVTTWNCWINYKNRYAGLLVLHLLPLLNPWLIVEM